MKYLKIIPILLILSGCPKQTPEQITQENDRRKVYFFECIKTASPGPNTVEQCERAAFNFALYDSFKDKKIK